eukprot:XP_017452349.1 PREDICTED: solute carrier organic anion transporter family member 6A1-like isoform X2 [Rattus norvegicus]
MERNLEQRQASTAKARKDNTLEAPVNITTEAPVDITTEAPVDITAQAPVDITAEALADITAEAWMDSSAEPPKEEWTDDDQEHIRVFPYQIRLSAAMSDVTGLQNANSETSSQLSDKIPTDLDGPFGLGSLVVPSLQRFNNINFFLISFCILTLAQELCKDEEQRTMPNCEKIIPFKSEIIYLSVIGQCFQGFASMPMYVLGMTYIYDNISSYLAGIYLGIADASFVLGYGLGYAVGSPNLRPSLNHSSEEKVNDNFLWWQFNWFLGFFSATLLAWFTVFPLLCFPHRLPGSNKLRVWKENEPFFYKKYKDLKYGYSFQDLLRALWYLVKNPLLMCYSMCKATESLALIGATEFLPKYLENQFLLSPSSAALLTGIILIPGGAIGNFLGGFIVSKMKMSCKTQMRFITVTSVISLLLFVLNAFVKCERVKFAGINSDYEG